MLKITLPHREARYEGEGLRVWNGNGAVGLFEEDANAYVLLLERFGQGPSSATIRHPQKSAS